MQYNTVHTSSPLHMYHTGTNILQNRHVSVSNELLWDSIWITSVAVQKYKTGGGEQSRKASFVFRIAYLIWCLRPGSESTAVTANNVRSATRKGKKWSKENVKPCKCGNRIDCYVMRNLAHVTIKLTMNVGEYYANISHSIRLEPP